MVTAVRDCSAAYLLSTPTLDNSLARRASASACTNYAWNCPTYAAGCFDTDQRRVEFSTQRTIIKTRNHLPGLDRVTLFDE